MRTAWYAFGTPGGDQQDQWQATFLLRLIHHGMNLQEAIDGPLFHTGHLQSSFFPRAVQPGHLLVEPAFSEATIETLRRRVTGWRSRPPGRRGGFAPWRGGGDGVVKGAATPRLMQAYAVGR
jgi:gamma-glutamyltranspeptidase/glutathione hydrolase